jgi:hypothetical protein
MSSAGAGSGTQQDVVGVVRSRRGPRGMGSLPANLDVVIGAGHTTHATGQDLAAVAADLLATSGGQLRGRKPFTTEVAVCRPSSVERSLTDAATCASHTMTTAVSTRLGPATSA